MLEKTIYATRPVRYTTIKAADLVDAASRNNSIPKSYIETACEAIANEFQNYILNGHSVKVPQVGTFRLVFKVKAGDTPEESSIKSRHIRLRAGKELSELLNRLTFVNEVSLKDLAETPAGGE
jgi:nucleoid DNA-binding protein